MEVLSELYSCSTRSARKSIAEEVKRRLPRKPWVEVRCPTELRELIYRVRKPRKAKDKTPMGTPTKSDHLLSDGKIASPVKSELAEAITPRINMNDENPPIKEQGITPPVAEVAENIGLPANNGEVATAGHTDAGGALLSGPDESGKQGGIGGANVDEPIVIDD